MPQRSDLAPETFDYKVVVPRTLNRKRRQEMALLIRQSFKADFGERTPAQLDYATDQIIATQAKPNKSVSGPLLRKKQSYAHNRTVLAIRDDRLWGILTTADNASSKRPMPLDMLEIQAKLRLDRGIGYRWRWLGLRALVPELIPKDMEIYDPNDLSVLDVMGHIAVRQGEKMQPVSGYPWLGEKLWTETLASWGLHPDEEAAL